VSAAPKRLTLLDCVGLGINGIIGTGIFLLPAKVFGKSGGMSWAAWLAIGGLCLLVGLCFCEASGRADRNGGPLLYAREAFGRWIGFGVGWMSLASAVFSYGAVARGFGRNLSYLVPALQQTGPQIAIALVVIFGLAALNYRGVKPGALVSDFFSGAKLVPLLLFVAVGLFFVDWHRLALTPPAGETRLEAIKVGGLAALFACTGFEYVPVPAGETDNPRRNVPLALFGALAGSILLYTLVQIVFMGTHPSPANADKPLAEAAGAFAGAWGGRFVAAGSIISSFGYLTGVALVAPRYLSSLGENGDLPGFFARVHPRFGTPFGDGGLCRFRSPLRSGQRCRLRPIRAHLPGGAGAPAHAPSERVRAAPGAHHPPVGDAGLPGVPQRHPARRRHLRAVDAGSRPRRPRALSPLAPLTKRERATRTRTVFV
jgi:amino acid transporter